MWFRYTSTHARSTDIFLKTSLTIGDENRKKKENDKKGKDIRYANMLQRSTNEYFQKLTAVYKKFKKY